MAKANHWATVFEGIDLNAAYEQISLLCESAEKAIRSAQWTKEGQDLRALQRKLMLIARDCSNISVMLNSAISDLDSRRELEKLGG